ncbi:hypothetical protein OPT61_g6915 [Boeremia exigua]|uniref:Uncharacterized protein n=1 Tax=Boeremia exigua TaxID=749465 RepID=A0ACC2I498_9PLEO|nr:hypothetical protein OPT61_g6915 [Boeremia exigua]
MRLFGVDGLQNPSFALLVEDAMSMAGVANSASAGLPRIVECAVGAVHGTFRHGEWAAEDGSSSVLAPSKIRQAGRHTRAFARPRLGWQHWQIQTLHAASTTLATPYYG